MIGPMYTSKYSTPPGYSLHLVLNVCERGLGGDREDRGEGVEGGEGPLARGMLHMYTQAQLQCTPSRSVAHLVLWRVGGGRDDIISVHVGA